MSAFLKGVIAAAIGGAAAAAGTVAVDAGDIKGSLAKLGTVIAIGALTAVVHLFVPSPKQA